MIYKCDNDNIYFRFASITMLQTVEGFCPFLISLLLIRFNIAARSAGGPPCGKRIVAGRIVKESYGAAKQQHTFTVSQNLVV